MLNSQKIVAFPLTTDYVRARSFYVDTLGLEFVSQDQFTLALRGNENMIRIVKSENFSPARHPVLGWEVSNIETAARDLISQRHSTREVSVGKGPAWAWNLDGTEWRSGGVV